ncbi:acyl-CoA N-acyltransferase [Bimuria novae-zelandiae CBS 107.79]|uniref:Acyl-CoA N-acyltransferase n=1 Tax=Bimuria novae-zelandiae CBS 107.79 TaxID=1447943 RepID=A0A6A5UFZ3_9PLEO|nr:acyl-CoA N-acyltransferase [Bimuria novae-zelandiae CBS 107.79]
MDDYNFHIETPRLFISRLHAGNDSHCDFLVDLYNTEQALARTRVGAPMPEREAARKTIESDDRIWTDGYGRYLVSLKPTTLSAEETKLPFSERSNAYTMIGVVSMKFRKSEGAPLAPDVGYGFLPAFQGKGYATEAAAALVKWFEDEKGQKEFFGFCDPTNEGSKGVLRRTGFEERGVKDVRGLKPDGDIVTAMVFSKGLTKELEKYGVN